MIFHPRTDIGAAAPQPTALRCAACGNHGTFTNMREVPDLRWLDQGRLWQAGTRRCPNPHCHALAFVVLDAGMLVHHTPEERLDFDSSNLPDQIRNSLEEAITCHAAGAYRASALMVRRVLEELCSDRGATGKDLQARLGNLGDNIVVPKELLEAANELRLLGNDAAHIEAKNYDAIGQSEAELAIELAKELLKAVYQYASLVDRLRGLRRPST